MYEDGADSVKGNLMMAHFDAMQQQLSHLEEFSCMDDLKHEQVTEVTDSLLSKINKPLRRFLGHWEE